jgi:hypothetical protein
MIQFALHDEQEVYRVVISPGGITHPVLGAFAEKGCIPKAAVLKAGGTITTVSTGGQDGKTVLGTSTSFIADVAEGDYLTDTNGICRKVLNVFSDTRLSIESKFPTDLTNYTATSIRKAKEYSSVEAKSTGTAAAILQEQTFVINDIFVCEGAPVSYDVSTASSQISFTLHV